MIRPIERLWWHWWCLRVSVRHAIRWLRFGWYDDDCDWAYLAEAMEIKLRCMASLFTNPAAPSRRDGISRKQMLVCAALLRRLRDDEYWINAVRSFGETRRAAEHAGYLQDQDQKYLGVVLGRNLISWWT